MDLANYLIAHDGTIRKDGPELMRIASEIGSTPYYVYMVALGHKKFGHQMTKTLELATGWIVSRYDTRPDIFGDPLTELQIRRLAVQQSRPRRKKVIATSNFRSNKR